MGIAGFLCLPAQDVCTTVSPVRLVLRFVYPGRYAIGRVCFMTFQYQYKARLFTEANTILISTPKQL
jgi:hypothetical protein